MNLHIVQITKRLNKGDVECHSSHITVMNLLIMQILKLL